MADQEILSQIRQLEERRPATLLDAPDLAAALDELRESWQTAADLYDRAKVKGAKTQHVAPLRHAAAQLALVVDALRAPRPERREPAPLAPPDTSHERLDALVNDAVAEGRGMLREDRPALDERHVSTELEKAITAEPIGGFPGQVSEDEVRAYLSGATNSLPGLTAALTPGSVRDMSGRAAAAAADRMAAERQATDNPHASADAVSVTISDIPVPTDTGITVSPDSTLPKTWESDTMTPDGHRPPGQAPALGQPGDMGSGYDHSYVPPGGRRLTFADLLTPVPAASLPAHLSHSQSETVGDCATKYRLQRVEALPEIPQWANIGGSAFHTFAEDVERAVAATGQAPAIDDAGLTLLWQQHFEAQIAKVQASTTVPISKWRASRKGAEGRQWWEVNGPLMLRRYLDARPADQSITIDSGGAPAIEWEFMADVPTPYGPIPFKVVIDRVTVTADGTLMIRDYKSSYERPTDTTQLGEYAHMLLLSGANLHGATRIMGTYFDARRGEWTEPVDLLQAHPFEAFQYRVTAAHAQKRALTTGPTPARPSTYCGGCAVRYACPIMAAKS